MSLTSAHSQLLTESAVDLEVAEEAGVRSVESKTDLPVDMPFRTMVPGIAFSWSSPSGETVLQYRPDNPPVVDDKPGPKYVFPKGIASRLWVHPRMTEINGTDHLTVAIVEGTKQYLAAVSAVPAGVFVVGMAGCNGWSTDGVPTPDLAELPLDGNRVVLVHDADVSTNRNVWDAAEKLGEACTALGAETVCFAKIPAGAKAGLDDWLASMPAERRTKAFDSILDSAGKLPRKPRRRHTPVSGDSSGEPSDRFFNEDGLKAVTLVDELSSGGDFALGRDGAVWVYREGVYVNDTHDLTRRTQDALGERWRGMHLRTAVDLLAARLAGDGLMLGESPLGALVNLQNGMLDPLTGTLHPHDPEYLSYAQLPVEWNPDAACPAFDGWMAERCGTQVEDLLESVSLMLTPWIGQRQAVFLFGPSRSGKGTFLRVVERIAGNYVSALTLHQLATNRFAAAGLYGMVLNSAGDLSDHHVDDLSVFKMLTGDDPVAAEKKFQDPYTFHNKALFAFSANTPPTVSETSRAYLNRVRPFLFPRTFEGHEDQRIEDELLAELPGVLVRLVEALRRWHDRGGYAPADPMVVDSFAQQSDVAALFAAQALTADAGGFVSGSDAFTTYKAWADANGRYRLGRNKFLARMDVALGNRERRDGRTGGLGWPNVRTLLESEWVDIDPCASFASSTFTSLHEGAEIEERDGDMSEPSWGGVGPERAKRAQPEPDPVESPDDIVELEL